MAKLTITIDFELENGTGDPDSIEDLIYHIENNVDYYIEGGS